MRKIDKSTDKPDTLTTAPVPTSAAGVSERYYKANEVREQLITDQYGKCCYCESDITKAFHDVEHYRPKTHYYWLGHDWDNLLYACPLCNRTLKNDAFPLEDESARANKPTDNIALETPLIINPSVTDPALHIRFRRHIAVGITIRGKKTIEVFDLNNQNDKRRELLNSREQEYDLFANEQKKLKAAEALLGCCTTQKDFDNANQIIALCRNEIMKLQSPPHRFSGMLVAQI